MASKKSKKHKLVMCRDFFGFGTVSLLVGLFFFVVTILTTVNVVRVIVVAFFVSLGIIDLLLYSLFKKS